MQPVSTLPKGRTHQMRPIQRPPSWIEAILHRPIRVECWSCLRPSWLHRNQKNESPSDWTCPHCKTHQCRDKDGNIVPVPEMFDESLNEDVTKRISYSLKNRRIAGDNDIRQTSRNDIFCEMCSGHQRVVYQLLSNYIPDEEDENYEAYYDSAETYRRQLEERYPLACVRCLDKVQKELAQQGHQIKSSLLNATLSKSRGDNIRPARKYPSIGWLFTGCSYLCAHTALLSTEIIVGFLGIDALFDSKIFQLPKFLTQSIGCLTLQNMIGALSKLYSSAFWPWSTSDGQLLRTLSDDELSAIVILGLMGLSIAGLYWDPMHFTIQRMPRIRIRERQYHIWARIGAVPLLVLQYLVLFIGQWKQNLTQLCSAILMLHIIYLLAFHTGRYLQEPLEFKLERQAISPPSSKVLSRNNALLENQHKTKKRESNAVSTSTRLAINSSELLHDGPRSRTDSPDIDQMSWSSNKPTLTSANHLSAAFGMYRDPNRHSEQESASFQPGSRPGSAEMFNNSFTAGNSNVKFHTRAYEPSPLANPSIIANMGLNNISLGEMLGFPSAKFQPPENHFAHRSARSQEQNETKSWSHREFTSETERSELNHSLAQLRRPLARSGFSDYTDADMNDEDDSLAFSSNHGPFGRDEKVKTPSSSGGSLESPRNCWTSDGRDLFAAQRYFPPEPETGLEDNFFGIVKIVDDYLPPQQGPRSIGGRNLMLKKRLARRWLILLLLCRTCFAWKFVFELSDALSWASQAMFIGVVIHATAFWALDEYRAVLRQMRKKTVAVEKKSPPEPNDPYEPRKVDHICSYLLLLLLAMRVVNIAWVLADNDGQLNVMDWSPRILHLVFPWREKQGVLWSAVMGWMQDISIMILLLILIIFGAGHPSSSKKHL